MSVEKRFLKYVSFDTMSDSVSKTKPSTKGQMELLKYLKEELRSFGINKIDLDEENGILYAKIESNIKEENIKSIGFIAHVDTAPDASGKNINPRKIENYNGENIHLNNEVILKIEEFPELKEYKNKTLIVTDGTTLLGADDKAGVAEIMSMAEYIMNNDILHGDICIAFTSDEEIARGTDGFDIKRFGADVAYTVDGGKIGEISYENFNAIKAKVIIKGKSIHTGNAKDKMINASSIACKFHNMVPKELPENTEMYEGFYHLDSIKGKVEESELLYNLRDFDLNKMGDRVNTLKEIAKELNKIYGENVVTVEFIDQYSNMKEFLKNDMDLIDKAIEAGNKVGIESFSLPIRGGTDGARLSSLGLPCPNLGTAGRNFHGVYEYTCIEDMEKITDLLVELVKYES